MELKLRPAIVPTSGRWRGGGRGWIVILERVFYEVKQKMGFKALS